MSASATLGNVFFFLTLDFLILICFYLLLPTWLVHLDSMEICGRKSIKACRTNAYSLLTSPMTLCSIILKFLPIANLGLLSLEWPLWLRKPSGICGISTISCLQTSLINPNRVCRKHTNINYSFISNRWAPWGKLSHII